MLIVANYLKSASTIQLNKVKDGGFAIREIDGFSGTPWLFGDTQQKAIAILSDYVLKNGIRKKPSKYIIETKDIGKNIWEKSHNEVFKKK